MKPSELQFAQNLEALKPPQCRRIVKALSGSDMSSAELSRSCKLSPGSIEKHVEVLFSAGLVEYISLGGMTSVSLVRSAFRETHEWFLDLSK